MKWEYNKVSSSCELTTSKLNELGKESWELVSVMQTVSVKYIGGVRIDTTSTVYYFKRPIE